jgi:hypothetical protein
MNRRYLMSKDEFITDYKPPDFKRKYTPGQMVVNKIQMRERDEWILSQREQDIPLAEIGRACGIKKARVSQIVKYQRELKRYRLKMEEASKALQGVKDD